MLCVVALPWMVPVSLNRIDEQIATGSADLGASAAACVLPIAKATTGLANHNGGWQFWSCRTAEVASAWQGAPARQSCRATLARLAQPAASHAAAAPELADMRP